MEKDLRISGGNHFNPKVLYPTQLAFKSEENEDVLDILSEKNLLFTDSLKELLQECTVIKENKNQYEAKKDMGYREHRFKKKRIVKLCG